MPVFVCFDVADLHKNGHSHSYVKIVSQWIIVWETA